MVRKLTRKQAIPYGRKGLFGFNYVFPDIEDGFSVIYAELSGAHGERTIGKRSRIYYITEGMGEFIVNGEKFSVEPGDVIPVPPNATYNYWPTNNSVLKCVLFMEVLDVSKLPK